MSENKKKCCCGPDCKCGCQEGKPCTCGDKCGCGCGEEKCSCRKGKKLGESFFEK